MRKPPPGHVFFGLATSPISRPPLPPVHTRVLAQGVSGPAAGRYGPAVPESFLGPRSGLRARRLTARRSAGRGDQRPEAWGPASWQLPPVPRDLASPATPPGGTSTVPRGAAAPPLPLELSAPLIEVLPPSASPTIFPLYSSRAAFATTSDLGPTEGLLHGAHRPPILARPRL